MPTKRFAFLATAILFLFMVPLAACGGSSAGASGPVTITYWYTEGTGEQDIIKSLVSDFQTANPNIKVNAQYVDFNSAHDKFVQAARAGSAPDVLRADVGWNTEFAADKFLYDITSKAGDTSDYLKAPLAYATWNGKLYGLPQVTDFLVLYYNKSMLQSANVTAPTTMQDFDAANKKLTTGGKYGWEFEGSSYFAQAFMFAFGGGLIDTSTNPPTPIVNNSGSVAGFNFLKQELAYAPKLDFANGYTNTVSDFKSGKVAMMINGPWEYNNILSGDAFKDATNLGMAALPYDSAAGNIARSPAGGQNYVMYAGTKNADAAFKFMQFMSSTDSQVKISTANKTIATRTSALSQLSGNAAVASFAGLLSSQKARPVTPLGGNIYANASGFDPNLQKFLTGQEDAQTAANAIAEGFKQQLATIQNS